MTAISKRDAMQLVHDIKRAKIGGHAIAARTGGGPDAATHGFLGGLESVLRHFLDMHGCNEASAALVSAMNDVPTDAQIAERNEEVARFRAKFPTAIAKARGTGA